MSIHLIRPLSGAHAAIVALAALGLAACDLRDETGHHTASFAASPSAQLIGTSPAPPTADEGTPVAQPLTATSQGAPPPAKDGPSNGSQPAAAKPEAGQAAAAQSELPKGDESAAMPLPGQPNDHSNLAPDGSQRAGQVDGQQTPERSPDSGAPQRESAAAKQTEERK